ncbi:MAG: nucleoside deaminase [Arcanobacterium sp.]|nr:nucleoside deaminase [Arcanobacterium sp.]
MREEETGLMRHALELAACAGSAGDVPVGAVITDAEGEILAQAFNTREQDLNPVGHAEVNAIIAAAAELKTWNLTGCTLVVTLEPCTMCAGAILNSRISRVIFGAWEPKTGAAGSIRDVLRDPRLPHQVEVIGGVLEVECAELVQSWFQDRR